MGFAGPAVPALSGAGAAACRGAAPRLAQPPLLLLAAPAEGCRTGNPPARTGHPCGVRLGKSCQAAAFRRCVSGGVVTGGRVAVPPPGCQREQVGPKWGVAEKRTCPTPCGVTQALHGPAARPLGLSPENGEHTSLLLTQISFPCRNYLKAACSCVTLVYCVGFKIACGGTPTVAVLLVAVDMRNPTPTKFSGIRVSLSSGLLRRTQPLSTKLYLRLH